MAMHLPNSARIAALPLLAGLMLASASARAQETDYCISCTNPDQTYICRVTAQNGQSQGQQLFCIMNIARENSHDSCKAAAQQGSCSGTLVLYDVSNLAPAPTPPTASEATAAATPPAQAAGNMGHATVKQANKKQAPKTLVEFTKKTAKNTNKGFKNLGKDTGKAIKKTGSKITKFTKKVGKNISKATKTTFRCITSLFSKCGKN